MTVVIPQRITKHYIKNHHQFRKNAKWHSVGDNELLREEAKDVKWWKMCKEKVEFVFYVLNSEIRSHKIKKLYQKRYAEKMYDHLFNLYMLPNMMSLKLLDKDQTVYPAQ